jgi:hypothetical protein
MIWVNLGVKIKKLLQFVKKSGNSIPDMGTLYLTCYFSRKSLAFREQGKEENVGFLLFLLLIGAVCVFIFVIGALLSLFSAIFGYDDDPYERKLARMNFEDAILDSLERQGGDTYIDVDARQIHFHKHE